jgi:beta-glucanase (GH16 family)
MRKIYLLAFLCFSAICSGQTPANDSHWNLIWSEPFSSQGTTQSNWEIKDDFDHYDNPMVFRSINVNPHFDSEINSWCLALNLKQEIPPYFCPPVHTTPELCKRQFKYNGYIPYYYSGGYIITTTPNIQYGYIEAKMKIPDIPGTGCAFWLWDCSNSYKEIDIFEMDPGAKEACLNSQFTHTRNIMTSCIHTQAPAGGCGDPNAFGSVAEIQDFTQWHTYGIEWSPSRIIWYIDDYPVRYYQNAQINGPLYLIINTALLTKTDPLGNIVLRTDDSGFPLLNNNNLPVEMLVDYVNVYELNYDCNGFINSTNYDFSSYNNVERRFIKIGNGGGNNSLAIGDEVKLRASQFIELCGNFYVPVGAKFYADVNKYCSPNPGIQCTHTYNPCEYDFSYYDNSVKKIIEIGGSNCSNNLIPLYNEILLKATDEIILKPGVTITPNASRFVEIKITSCY